MNQFKIKQHAVCAICFKSPFALLCTIRVVNISVDDKDLFKNCIKRNYPSLFDFGKFSNKIKKKDFINPE